MCTKLKYVLYLVYLPQHGNATKCFVVYLLILDLTECHKFSHSEPKPLLDWAKTNDYEEKLVIPPHVKQEMVYFTCEPTSNILS